MGRDMLIEKAIEDGTIDQEVIWEMPDIIINENLKLSFVEYLAPGFFVDVISNGKVLEQIEIIEEFKYYVPFYREMSNGNIVPYYDETNKSISRYFLGFMRGFGLFVS